MPSQQIRTISDIRRTSYLYKLPKNFNPNKERFIIQGETKGTKVYFVDDIVGWTLRKCFATQFFGRVYTEDKILPFVDHPYLTKFGPVYKRQKPVKNIEVVQVKKKDLNPDHYAENIFESNVFLLNAYSYKQVVVNRKRKATRKKNKPKDQEGKVVYEILEEYDEVW